jgi:hypothetical protein
MDCRKCGACCIGPSITTAMPGMPKGKPAGMRCVNLDDNLCRLYGRLERPAFCGGWQPDPAVCGGGFQEAMANIAILEESTGAVPKTGSEVGESV